MVGPEANMWFRDLTGDGNHRFQLQTAGHCPGGPGSDFLSEKPPGIAWAWWAAAVAALLAFIAMLFPSG
jgi:hypothetical protein